MARTITGERVAKLSLQNLIHAVAGAVVEAQDQIHRVQVATIRGYFDEDNRPRSVDIRLPSTSPGAEKEDRILHVPLLSLAGAHLLNIKEVAVDFEVGLGAYTQPPPRTDDMEDQDAAATPTGHQLGVDMSASPKRDSGTMARVTLKVETSAPSEGMARLLQHLDKLI